MDHQIVGSKLYDLPTGCLEKIATYLDTRANLNMLFSNKKVYSKLVGGAFFWKHLCELEGLDKVSSLSDEEINKEDEHRLAWSGELLHSNETREEATRWQKIYQRGIQMRRNLAAGKCEMWRLFMTDDKDCLPVRKMSPDTQPEFLGDLHSLSPDTGKRAYVRVHRYWNEEFMVVMQYDMFGTFHDIFVWKWQKCQNPVFLYSMDLLPTYPNAIFPTSSFIHRNFFVLMPDTGFSHNQKKFSSMVRVHDLSDGFKLVGKFDFEVDSELRRHTTETGNNEPAHLHKLGDKAVALCRTPELTVLIFSIPDCKLEHLLRMKDLLKTSYEHLVLDERFLVKDNTMVFLFHDPNFYVYDFGFQPEVKYGRLLHLDFDAYVHKKGDINIREYKKFDRDVDCIEKICLNNKTQMTRILSSGDIVVKDLDSSQDLLTIEVPEELDDEVDCDRPILCCGPGGDIIIAYRNFTSGRKIHAYNKVGVLLYEINVDDPMYDLVSRRGYISVDLNGRLFMDTFRILTFVGAGSFLMVADLFKVVIFNSKSGAYVHNLVLPKLLDTWVDLQDYNELDCGKGQTNFAFSEDGIIVFHSQRNFPIAADVLLFW